MPRSHGVGGVCLSQKLRFLDPRETCRLRVGKRRDSHEIVGEILESARGGATKTQIMARAKLNHSQTEEYLSLLIKKGFLVNLVVADGRQTTLFFKTSDLGRKFLESLWALEI